MNGSDISDLARISYESGIEPVDYAEGQIVTLINVQAAVALTAELEPETFPGGLPDVSVGALARRILGELLDAGWQPPVWPVPEPGCGRAHG